MMTDPQRSDRGWLNTYTGHRFYPLAEDAATQGPVAIRDIAHALSMLCRYTGHVKRFYSVAEHSVRLAGHFLCSWRAEKPSYVNARYALIHDASEAYLSDLNPALKRRPEFAFYRQAEERLQARIYQQYGLELADEPDAVRRLDKQIVANEAHALFGAQINPAWRAFMPEVIPDMPTQPAVWGWSPEEAECAFMATFREIFRRTE